ncbi:efflux RND transporter periplasmic adaptor subunit [Agitococcus lubricus]|uniref:Membrane fusion protein (Multidrug efflux system) n=1 Tax=Agitococcus lubricus TaxID=1077255 RepID=A0A2T5J167_9GAMM|nr:efflux RND transporter periplasmic adaptor subunit [Agitococcus lubricus]PTQ90084.1 membrane fusion protein (multidrug efflux system) [Agitococcus lubricus]
MKMRVWVMLWLCFTGIPSWTFAQTPTKKPPPTVEVQTVTRAKVMNSLTAIATVRASESVVLKPEVAGRVTAIKFQEGQTVKQGQLLIQLDDDLLNAELETAQASLDLAQAEYRRYQALIKEQQISALDYERKKAELSQAKAAVSLVQAKLRQKQIRAPFTGLLGIRSVAMGDVVQANQSLVRLSALSPLKLDIKVPETQAKSIYVGQSLTVSIDAVTGLTLNAQVQAIEPALDSTTRALIVRALTRQGDNRVKEGMTARASFVLNQRDDIVIPEQALVAQRGKFVVYTVKNNIATAVPVVVGSRQVGKVAIQSGLQEGDAIVVSGQNKLSKPEMPINAVMVQGAL